MTVFVSTVNFDNGTGWTTSGPSEAASLTSLYTLLEDNKVDVSTIEHIETSTAAYWRKVHQEDNTTILG